MEFSKQDARFEAKPLDLSEYSAADMMNDLGIHRRVMLPLQGKASVIPPPPPDTHKRGPMLARIAERDAPIISAWASVYDPNLEEERNDGLGAGQMHRTGANFNPDEVCERPSPRLRRVRSIEANMGHFELGRRPGRAAYPRQAPEPARTQRMVAERRRNRSPDELGPEGDILAELRAESKVRMSKYRATRPAGRVIGHHIAANPPAGQRGSPNTRSRHHVPSRVIPPNPLTSQWGAGTKLATAKAGYDYAMDFKAKTPADFALQDRSMNKVIHAAPRVAPGFTLRVAPHLALKLPAKPPQPAPLKVPPAPTPVPETAPIPAILPFPNPSQFPQSAPTETAAWAGDKPFTTDPSEKLTDVTNIDTTPKPTDPPKQIPTPIPTPAQSVSSSPNLAEDAVVPVEGPTNPPDEVPSYALEENDTTFVAANSDITSSFELPPPSDSADQTQGEESLRDPSETRGEDSHSSSEAPDELEELLQDLQAAQEAVKELKARCLDHGVFKEAFTVRMNDLRLLEEEMMDEVSAEEERLGALMREVGVMSARRAALAIGLREIAESQVEVRDVGVMTDTGTEVDSGEETEVDGGSEKVEVSFERGVGEEAVSGDGSLGCPGGELPSLEAERERERFEDSVEEERPEQNKLQEESFEGRLEREEKEKVRLQKILARAEQIKKENLENERLAAERLEQQRVDHIHQDETLKKLQEDCRQEREAERAKALALVQERTARRILEEAKDKQIAEQVEKERLEIAVIEKLENDAKERVEKERVEKARIEQASLEAQRLEREQNEKARIEANRLQERARVEELRLEEEKLVREHMEKVRRQEELFKAERAEKVLEHRREKERLDAEKLAKDLEISFAKERLASQTENLERRFGGTHPERQSIRSRRSTVVLAASPFPSQIFEERKPSVPTTEPSTSPASPTLSVITVTEKAVFPYTLDLDLRPMYGPEAIRVRIEQFDRPQDAILKRCAEVLTSAQHAELSQMPDFQRFLVQCNGRHTRRIASVYEDSGWR